MREATATWIRPQHEYREVDTEQRHTRSVTRWGYRRCIRGTTKVKAAEQNIPAIIQILRLLIGAIPPLHQPVGDKTVNQHAGCAKRNGIAAINPVLLNPCCRGLQVARQRARYNHAV